MIKSDQKITGISMPEGHFEIYESCKTIEADRITKILNGQLAAYQIHEYLSLEECQKITHNFWASPGKTPRFGYGEDGVEGYFIGASHIEKTTLEYLQESQKYASSVEDLYKNTVNPLTLFRNSLHVQSRAAQLNGLSAGHSKAVYWNNTGHFLLEPHDDLAQLRDPRQQGFEIQQVSRVMAVNFYPSVALNSGQLKIWNIEPDDHAREQLGLMYSGYPYPAELLDDYNSIIISIEAGDLCIINGNLIHAVLRGNPQSSLKSRLLITAFMGFNHCNELIWWT